MALLYNDKAVLENHHASATFRLVREDSNNILLSLSKEDYKYATLMDWLNNCTVHLMLVFVSISFTLYLKKYGQTSLVCLSQLALIGDHRHRQNAIAVLCSYQWWANHKSNHIKWNQIQITNQIKSRCQPNENSYRLYSLCAKGHQCTSGLTVNVSAKIRDGTITEINSLTQLQ